MEERRIDEDGGKRRGVLARLRPVETASDPGLEGLFRRLRQHSPKADLKLVERAYEFAAHSHRDQRRASGGDFIEHPLAVAEILADLGLDTMTIVAALLHDTVEDTPVAIDDVEREFGSEVAVIIDGLTKLDKIEFRSKEHAQAENLRKMMIAMARDIRVLLIKLADRLHNMRTIGHLPRDTQEKKATETLEIYSPLAHRLGIHQIKWQLEDLSFGTLHPRRFEEIVRMVEERQPERDAFIEKVLKELDDTFRTAKLKADVSGRPKHYWSIYEKMVGRGKEFGEIYDLIGIRVHVESLRDCYAALGLIHALWKPVPGRFKDYIAMPKFNMYQSLHTTVVGPEGKPLEIQIRTKTMHATAEYGIAAHWKYKEGKGGTAEPELSWLNQMLDWQRDLSDPREFMESLKIDLYQDQVFVFTPKGEVLSFPHGATPVDFAYSIHTDVGHHCVGAKVNGRLVPLDYRMKSGDTVEVLTSRSPTAAPSQDWLKVVRTPRARNKIRQWFTRERRVDAIDKGQQDLVRALRKANLPVQSVLGSDALQSIIAEHKAGTLDDLYAAIGNNHISTQSIVQRLQHELEDEDEHITAPRRPQRMKPPSEHGVTVVGIDDVMVRLARCCTPVPRDPIIGFVTRGRGLSVHRADCPNAKSLLEEEARIIEVAWDTRRPSTFQVTIQVEALDRTKLLKDVTTAISDVGVNILSASSNTNARTRTAILRFTVELGDPAHLDYLISSIKRVDAVYDAYRLTPGHNPRGHRS
ncbi:MAG: bifunctional (p)ppGpp synthetase/guanosine-3',5'-bis(diphosphate) 3'-pyrophosphohydrolase [Actinomycetota bacterium]|nr:bifunctional (p)ppGpp synthetase/guanosine-3',5'-bis(diphosphate) 3'-pyrophosphohydrolase [Actinomycetota bacterium]